MFREAHRLGRVISRLDLRDASLDPRSLAERLPRAEFDLEAAIDVVAPICDDVRARGAEALRDLGERFDGVRPEHLRVPAEVLAAALEQLDPAVREALEESIRRARTVHAEQMPRDHVTRLAEGGSVGQRWIPVRRVGLYVPGGLAVYPSSVVMNVVPAQEAGVGSLAVTSPPQRDNTGIFAGYPHPTILAACALLGVDEVYAVGGAQAIAMFAYGAREADGEVVCEPAVLVTGPGNVYVASAKRHLKSIIGIDAEAGPTEIAILADGTADPVHVAADLVSQAEHDTLAASVLVTHDAEFAERVEAALEAAVAATKHQQRVSTALAGRQSAIVLVDDLDAGVKVVDAYGAEHLEIQTADAAEVAARITNAGAIFVGPYSPVSLGDYCSGSNHVLPTSGTAAYASGLGVHAFLRSVQVIDYDKAALGEVARRVVDLARAEDLPGHGDAIIARFGTETDLPDAPAAPAVTDVAGAPHSTGKPAGHSENPADAIHRLLALALHGRTAYGAPQLDVPVALNTNENSYPVPETVVEAIREAVTKAAPDLNRYPDREFTQLRDDLAAYLTATGGVAVETEQIWAGNGSNEVLLHLLQAFGGPGRRALGFTPSYSMHPIITRTAETEWIDGMRGIDSSAPGAQFDLSVETVVAQIEQHRPHVVFLCSPNNPTGTALDLGIVEAAYDSAPNALIIVDEAYAEFARPGTPSALTLLAGRPRLVVTRTMSKAFARAGGRLGYLAADPALVDALRLVRMPYHLSMQTQVTASAALAHADLLLANVEAIKEQRDRIVTQIEAMGLQAVPSDANFVLFGGLSDAPAAWQALLDRGVLVRDVGLPGYLRVTAGTPAETDAFLSALRAIMQVA